MGSVCAPNEGLLGHQRHLGASGSSYFGAPALPYIPGVQDAGRVTGGGPRSLTAAVLGLAWIVRMIASSTDPRAWLG